MGLNVKDAETAYAVALAAACGDDGSLDAAALAIADLFGLDLSTAEDALRVAALINHVGLLPAKIVPDGKWFSFDSRLQPGGGWRGFVMPVGEFPVFGGANDDCVDLVAFAVDGAGNARTWRYTGRCAALGFDAHDDVIEVFTSPLLWLKHWLARCEDFPHWLTAAETGPEAFAALVLDPAALDWTPYRIEAGVTACKEIRFRDSPELRDQVAREMSLRKLTLPRLRAAKLVPVPLEHESPQHGPPRVPA